jgi:cation diffusion facilitator family transporter
MTDRKKAKEKKEDRAVQRLAGPRQAGGKVDRAVKKHHERERTARRKRRVARLSVGSNTFLFIMKLAFGFYMGSISVMSEGVHSGMDLLAAVIATIAVYRSSRPADDDHAYGHGKYESLSGTAEAFLIFVAAIIIIYESIHKILFPVDVGLLEWGILIMLVSMLLNIAVSRTLMKVAKETESMALEADALHLSTDVWTSAGVLTGLVLIKFTGFHILDPVVAILVAILIIKAAYDLTKRTFSELTDTRIPEEEERIIMKLLDEHDHVIHDYHKLRTRMSGPERHIDVHIVVSKYLGLEEAHNLNDHLEREIMERVPRAHVLIHSEPCYGQCEMCDEEDVCEELRRTRLERLKNGETGLVLTDKDMGCITDVTDKVLDGFDEVVAYHDLKADPTGGKLTLTLHVIVKAELTVERSHDINHILENKLRYLYPGVEVIAHMEPCDGNCEQCEEEGCDKASGSAR